MRTEIVPAYAIVDCAWDLLKLNTDMKESDYNGKIPVIPASQQPEFTDQSKPFLVYGFTDNPTYDLYPVRGGQVAFAVYATTDREIAHIANVMSTYFGRWDEAATDVNRWTVGGIFQGITFTNFSVGILEGPSPESTEGGRKSGVIMIRYECIPQYSVVKP